MSPLLAIAITLGFLMYAIACYLVIVLIEEFVIRPRYKRTNR